MDCKHRTRIIVTYELIVWTSQVGGIAVLVPTVHHTSFHTV